VPLVCGGQAGAQQQHTAAESGPRLRLTCFNHCSGAPVLLFLQLQVNELLSEVALCRQPGKAATVAAAVDALTTALATLPMATLTPAGAAAAGVAGIIASLGSDAQVCVCARDASARSTPWATQRGREGTSH
jgi:hypothetical protein